MTPIKLFCGISHEGMDKEIAFMPFLSVKGETLAF
jgi:hypothetical protein